MTRGKLLAASILASTALFGATAAAQAASPVLGIGPQAQVGDAQATPPLLHRGEDRNDSGAADDDYDGDEFDSVEANDRGDETVGVEDDDGDGEGADVEDDDRGLTDENEGNNRN